METSQTTEHRIELPRSHAAGAVARNFVDTHYEALLTDIAYTDARMIVSELVNNAVQHGTGRIFLTGRLEGQTLRVEVVDEGTGRPPAIREQPEGTVGGWGLRIVDTIARRWGAFDGTTRVWAEIAV